jgi:hypothetical protein
VGFEVHGKQYHGNELVVPRERLRRCQKWTREAISALRRAGVLRETES